MNTAGGDVTVMIDVTSGLVVAVGACPSVGIIGNVVVSVGWAGGTGDDAVVFVGAGKATVAVNDVTAVDVAGW